MTVCDGHNSVAVIHSLSLCLSLALEESDLKGNDLEDFFENLIGNMRNFIKNRKEENKDGSMLR